MFGYDSSDVDYRLCVFSSLEPGVEASAASVRTARPRSTARSRHGHTQQPSHLAWDVTRSKATAATLAQTKAAENPRSQVGLPCVILILESYTDSPIEKFNQCRSILCMPYTSLE